MTTPVDDTYCPLCQSKNDCGVNEKEPCWCTKAKVPNELIAQVPQHLKKKACICQQCIKKFHLDNVKEVR